MFNHILDIPPLTSNTPSDELQHYLTVDTEDVVDGLMWWHDRHAMFPHLSHMAQDYLSIPGE